MESIQNLLSAGKEQLVSRLHFTNRYIDDVMSINNLDYENNLDQMYAVELEIKHMIENITSASYLDFLVSTGRDGQLHTSISDKRYDFHITNFPFLSNHILSQLANGVSISYIPAYSSRHLVPSHLGLAYVLLVG